MVLRGIEGALLCVLLVSTTSLAEEDLSSVNMDQLGHFWSVIESSNRPATVVAFGDSLQATYRSLPKPFFRELGDMLGWAGLSFDGEYPPNSTPVITNGAYRTTPTANWFLDHHVLPAGGSIYWRNSRYPNDSMPANQVGLYFVGWPQGGDFIVSLSTNGGEWAALGTISGYRLQSEGCFTNWAVTAGSYRLRVDSVSGTNLVLWQELVDTQSVGITTAWLQKDGHDIHSILSRPTSVLYPILSNLQPDLVLWHMKETADFVRLFGEASADLQFSNRLEQLETWWQTSMPEGQVVYVGTPWAYSDTSDYTIRQNRIVRENALRHGRVYFDGATPMVSYTFMVTNGYLADFVHPSGACYDELSRLLWNELGFFALRLDRRLSQAELPEGLWLEWATRTNVLFELQSSTNLLEWHVVHSVAGNGSRHDWTNAVSPSTTLFHRLELTGQ